MKCLLLAFLVLGGVSLAEPRTRLPPDLHGPQPPKLDLDSVCDGLLSAAGFGISSGKIVFMRRGPGGKAEEVAAQVGPTRLLPAFDVSLGGASALMRLVF